MISQDQEDKLYNYLLDISTEVNAGCLRDILAGGCRGYDEYTVDELVEEAKTCLSVDEGEYEHLCGPEQEIAKIIMEYEANQEIHKTLGECK